ncbi:MAG TPA: hypothetical protein VIK91_10895 [Nannocystis sp.]
MKADGGGEGRVDGEEPRGVEDAQAAGGVDDVEVAAGPGDPADVDLDGAEVGGAAVVEGLDEEDVAVGDCPLRQVGDVGEGDARAVVDAGFGLLGLVIPADDDDLAAGDAPSSAASAEPLTPWGIQAGPWCRGRPRGRRRGGR